MLVITKQVEKEILKAGLDLGKTIAQLQDLTKNYKSDVNFIDLYINREQNEKVGVYFMFLDKNDEYNHLNDERIYFNGNFTKIYKKLLLQLTSTIEAKTEAQKVLNNNFYIKELDNNRPLTLLKAINGDFIEFIALNYYSDGSLSFNEFTMNENKCASRKNFLSVGNCWDADNARKEAKYIYAIYNKKYAEYIRLQDEAEQKRQNRKNNKINDFKRFNYCDKDFKEAENIYKFTIYNFGYNSLTDHRFDNCAGAYISYNGNKYEPKADNRREVFNYMIDKNGYFILKNKANLYERAKRLKAKRQQEAKEEAHQLWINSAHDEQEKALNRYLTDLQNKIILLSDFNSLLNSDNFSILKKWRELYLTFTKQLNYNNYADAQEWGDKLSEKIKEFNFYNKAVKNGVFNKIACYHHYDLINGVYVMNNKADQFWCKYYINEF